MTTVESIERDSEVWMYLRGQQELEAPSEVSIESLSAGPASALHLSIPSNSLGLVDQSQSQSIPITSNVDDLAFDSESDERLYFFGRHPVGNPFFLERHNVELFRLIAQQTSDFPFRSPTTSSALSPFYSST